MTGVVGARTDIPGALELPARGGGHVSGPRSCWSGETTLVKEAVAGLLGDQATHILNVRWVAQAERLVTAAGLLRDAVRAGRLDAADLPTELADLILGEHLDPEGSALALLPTLLDHVDAVRDGLATAEHSREANDLLTATEQQHLPVYNPYLVDLLKASEEIGFLLVLHNDFGLARVLADGRFGEAVPDGRNGMPLLGLLAEHRRAKVVIAHLGMGKFTGTSAAEEAASLEYLRLWDWIFSNPQFDHVYTDDSWSEVTRRLLASEAITDAFVDLVRKHGRRIVNGSDAVKPESASEYLQYLYERAPIHGRIRDELGEDAYHDLRHGNLERLLLKAQEDVQRWAYMQLTSGMWKDFRSRFSAERNRFVDEWVERYELEIGPPDEEESERRGEIEIVGPGAWRNRHDRDTEQIRSFMHWVNAVDDEVASGRRLVNLRLFRHAVSAWWRDGRAAATDRKHRESAAQGGTRRAGPRR